MRRDDLRGAGGRGRNERRSARRSLGISCLLAALSNVGCHASSVQNPTPIDYGKPPRLQKIGAGPGVSPECAAVFSSMFGRNQQCNFCPNEEGIVGCLPIGALTHGSGVPDGQMERMFFEEPQYQACRDIFAHPSFQNAVTRIRLLDPKQLATVTVRDASSLDQTQQAMAAVFLHAGAWSYDYSAPKHGRATVYGCTDFGGQDPMHPDPVKLTLYRSACTPVSIYDFDIGLLDPALRFFLIGGHELGHVMDVLSGEALQSPLSREPRATVLGSILAACNVRLKIMRLEADTLVDAVERRCKLGELRRVAAGLEKARELWKTSPEVVPTQMGNAFGCMSSMNRKEAALNTNGRCPVIKPVTRVLIDNHTDEAMMELERQRAAEQKQKNTPKR